MNGLQFIASYMLVICLTSCSMNSDKSTGKFLNDTSLKGIDQANILRTFSTSKINEDYGNRNYFVLIQMSQEEYDQFLTLNDFKREEVLSVPQVGSMHPKVPGWWNVSKVEPKQFSKRIFNKIIIVTRTKNGVFLYGSD